MCDLPGRVHSNASRRCVKRNSANGPCELWPLSAFSISNGNEKGKPFVRKGRKAAGLTESAGPPTQPPPWLPSGAPLLGAWGTRCSSTHHGGAMAGSARPSRRHGPSGSPAAAVILLSMISLNAGAARVPNTSGRVTTTTTTTTARHLRHSRRRAAGNSTPLGMAGSWQCTFDDEFNGTSLDPSHWAPQLSATSGYTTGSAAAAPCYVNTPSTISVSGGYSPPERHQDGGPDRLRRRCADRLPGRDGLDQRVVLADVRSLSRSTPSCRRR